MKFLAATRTPAITARSQLRQLAPLFLLILFLLPTPVIGAENFFNPRPPDDSIRIYNNTLTVFPGCCEILIMKSCYNDSVEFIESNNQVLQYVGDNDTSNTSVPILNEWLFTTSSLKNCPGGCSNTLSGCRPELPWQFLEVIALFVVLGVVAYFAYDLGIVGIMAGAASWIMTLYLATWDAFSEPLLTLVRIMPLLYLLFLVFSWRFKADLDTDEET